MEWLRKSRLDVRMALIAEGRLFRSEQCRLRFKLVDAVAAGATDEGFSVGGPLEVRVLTNVASQALLLHLFRCCLCELKNPGRNPAAFNMGLTRSVAAFARHTFAAMLKFQLAMRIIVEALHLVLMAQGAGFFSDVVRRLHRRFWGRRCSLRLAHAGGMPWPGSAEPTN